MGDVILTLPVLHALSSDYPEEEIVFLTKKPFDIFIKGVPGIRIFLSDHHGRHKGLTGLFRLWSDIRREYNISVVADLHDVLRSQVLRLIFRLSGSRVAVIDKGRRDKSRLLRGMRSGNLKHTVERYCSVLGDAGYDITLKKGPWLRPTEEGLSKITALTAEAGGRLIGIAPMAKHELKMWPSESMIRLMKMLRERTACTIFIFGSPDEAEALARFAVAVPGVIITAGKIRLEEEIALISRLDIMIAMDSSNMHLASMTGVKTLSIWGATHPMAGFSAWGMPAGYQIQVPEEELTCRPCTIYGKGECRRGDLACLNWLTPEKVFEKIHALLNI